MTWGDRIISGHTTFWEGRLPNRNIFSITKVHPGSIAEAAGIETGQYYYAGDEGFFDTWHELGVRAEAGEVVSRIFDPPRQQYMRLHTTGFPWGMRLEAPHFKLCDDLRRALPELGMVAERIMHAPEALFRELTQAALDGFGRRPASRLLLKIFAAVRQGRGPREEVLEGLRVAAATGAIVSGDLATAQALFPQPNRNLLVGWGTGLAGLYNYTAAMIAAKAGGPRADVAGLLLAAANNLPDCERIREALRSLGEPVPVRSKHAGRTFPFDYSLPVVDPRLALPGPDCPILTLSEELALLRPDQLALVILLGGYRSNGFYSRSMESLGHFYPLIRDRLPMVHVITSALVFTQEDRAFTEGWMSGEAYAKSRGVPVVVLTDGEDTVANALSIAHSPTNYLLGRNKRVLFEGWLDDDGPIWEALAMLEAARGSASPDAAASGVEPGGLTD